MCRRSNATEKRHPKPCYLQSLANESQGLIPREVDDVREYRPGKLEAAVWRAMLGIMMAGVMPACSPMGDNPVTVFADPGKYQYSSCEQIVAYRNVWSAKEQELKMLMDKADQGVGGAIVNVRLQGRLRGRHRRDQGARHRRTRQELREPSQLAQQFRGSVMVAPSSSLAQERGRPRGSGLNSRSSLCVTWTDF